MIKTCGLVILFAVSFGCASAVHAASAAMNRAQVVRSATRVAGPRLPKGFVVKKLHLRELDLTNAQRRSISKAIRTNRQDVNKRLRSLHLQRVRNAFWSATPGSSDFNNATKAMATADAEFAGIRAYQYAKVREAIYGVLTPSQQARVVALREQ